MRWRWRARRSAWRPNASPSRSRLAELQIKTGDDKRATKTLERGWALAPHPDLAELYLKASGESEPLKRVGVMRRLAAQKPDDIESHLALAQASLDAGLWGEARRYLETAGSSHPTVRVCRMMAEVEERAQSGPGQGARLAGARGRCAGRPRLALRGLRRASRELAFGVRELRRVRHLALARAGHFRPCPAARSARGAGVRGKHNEIERQERRERNMFETTLAGSLPKPSWLATPNVLWAPWTQRPAAVRGQGRCDAARHSPPGRGRHRHRERRRAGAAAFRAWLFGRGRRRRLRQESAHGHPQQPL